MLSRNRDLIWALIAIFLITLLYTGVVVQTGSLPAAKSFFGHSLGVIGFIFMLMTETLYSLRKRARSARWGKMAAWLQFHIFGGIIGPYLVLLHSAWKFNGLAGVVLLLTAIIVISGFIGRYIYTAVPRTADGVELQAREIGAQICRIEAELNQQVLAEPEDMQILNRRLMTLPAMQTSNPVTVLGRAFTELDYRLAWLRYQRRLPLATRARLNQLEKLAEERRRLHRQMSSLAMARRLLAIWHAIHIPIGAALFIAAFAHIAAAIYYATLLH